MATEPQISITLSPGQIEEIVRSADPGRAPGFAALISAALSRADETRHAHLRRPPAVALAAARAWRS